MTPHRSSPTPRHRPVDRSHHLPDRQTSMWPDHGPAPAGVQATTDQIDAAVADAQTTTDARPTTLAPRRLADALADLPDGLANQHRPAQRLHINTTADRHSIARDTLRRAATSIGSLILTIAPTPTHLDTSYGSPAWNALRHADLLVGAELYLARARLANLTAHTAPDLPRLALLLNGLTHAVPAADLRTVPATLPGRPTRPATVRRDLVGWQGLPAAVDHLTAVLTASRAGRHWIRHHLGHNPDAIGRAIGVLHLTHPGVATELAALGPHRLDPTDLRAVTRTLQPFPDRITELSDTALTAMCERNGWLLGRPEEYHHRLLLDEHLIRTVDDLPALRRRLADPDVDPAQLVDLPDDTVLPPPIPPASAHLRSYLRLASTQALHDFAGLPLPTSSDRCTTLAARWPPTILERAVALEGVPLSSHLHLPTAAELPSPPTPDLALGP
ncbi:hypothetical protein ND748_07775 [Frankia sp. AiPs1]|uniref:hypothetical protein n=1 Tax=Frankia sp. AiPs1 TaxID=573493 RepID=UPI00204444DC|nr:hypothetical protein [Frankia sp. AiPs1]MCM3921563.1 hypothetical protein [Frankia sp. AiPs1]